MNSPQFLYTLVDQESDGDTPRPLRFKKKWFYCKKSKRNFWDKSPLYPKTLMFDMF